MGSDIEKYGKELAKYFGEVCKNELFYLMYLISKCEYHQSRALELHKSYLEDFKRISKDVVQDILDKERIDLKLDGKTEYLFEFDGIGNIRHPFSFEYDTFVNDARRIIEYTLRILHLIVLRKQPNNNFGVENFFKGLNKEIPNPNDLVKELIKDTEFSKYLLDHWGAWIKTIQEYRTFSAHTKIPKISKIKITASWNTLTKTQLEPSKVSISESGMYNSSHIEFLKNIMSYTGDFSMDVLKWVYKNYGQK